MAYLADRADPAPRTADPGHPSAGRSGDLPDRGVRHPGVGAAPAEDEEGCRSDGTHTGGSRRCFVGPVQTAAPGRMPPQTRHGPAAGIMLKVWGRKVAEDGRCRGPGGPRVGPPRPPAVRRRRPRHATTRPRFRAGALPRRTTGARGPPVPVPPRGFVEVRHERRHRRRGQARRSPDTVQQRLPHPARHRARGRAGRGVRHLAARRGARRRGWAGSRAS